MKTNGLWVAGAIALGFASCTPKNQATLNGDLLAADSLNVQSVVVKGIDGVADTVKVVNNHFTFKKVIDAPKLVFVSSATDINIPPLEVVLEPNLISTLTISAHPEKVTRTGGALNEQLEKDRKKAIEVNAKMTELISAFRALDPKAEDALAKRDSISDVYDKETEALESYLKDNFTAHSSDALGGLYLKQVVARHAMTPDEIIAAISLLPEDEQKTEDIAKIRAQAEVARKTAVGQPYVDFEMKDMKGKAVKLSDFIKPGQVTIVDFWASWCGPCRRSMPGLAKLYKKYKAKGFQIVGVSLDSPKSEKAWHETVKKLKMTWPQMSDLKYWDCAARPIYNFNAIPFMVIVDKDGKIAARGLHDIVEIEKEVKTLLAK